MAAEAFAFAVGSRWRIWSRLFLVHPETCTFVLDPHRVTVVFGRWRLTTPISNIASASVTGPYRAWRVLGPPRIALADRGAVFATTTARGLRLDLVEPVRAADPFPWIRHPSITVTVEHPDHVAEQVRLALAAPAPGPVEDDDLRRYLRGSRIGTLRALLRRQRSRASEREEDATSVPPPPPARRIDDLVVQQSFDDGTGPAYHRRYEVDVMTTWTAEDAMGAVGADLNRLTDPDLAPVNKIRGTLGTLAVGDRLVVALAGPWSGPVETVSVTPTSFQLATLRGHLEAGGIEFAAHEIDGGLRFRVETWARSGDHVMQMLYDRVGIARRLQTEMWIGVCEAFVELVDGTQLDRVRVLTHTDPNPTEQTGSSS